MRALIQRVNGAQVSVGGEVIGAIEGEGLCVLLGVTHADGPDQVKVIARKIASLRLLHEEKSVVDVGAPVLLISQFTLYGDVRKGRRPTWSKAAPGEVAEPLVDAVAKSLREEHGVHVETGKFGADMQVQLVNDGPFTIMVESEA
ncbi:D-aminoacyl-tRNA deacylase [Gleimia hominis]|uniref:D-aminoacyl-tRNA deacylase n=1 Tax=Gleimia hominis TaxID=595468 RepID=UPI000C80D012|nr:D-aminoacyl-tRNA deacylase [Gleimia hominis]WIK64483.1 D-aminoacyl-tRNA deacylase [Gleimia hominis]